SASRAGKYDVSRSASATFCQRDVAAPVDGEELRREVEPELAAERALDGDPIVGVELEAVVHLHVAVERVVSEQAQALVALCRACDHSRCPSSYAARCCR